MSGFDAPAYLARIGLSEAPPATAEGLAVLQRAHRLAIPFENLDVNLGRGIAIDSGTVFAKLVTARRGGYCFEHNRLFGDALAAFGFVARPLLARVWLAAVEVPPLTHTLSLVTIDGRDWIADAGFGGSDTPPLPLTDGASALAPDGARFRIERDPLHGWAVLRDGDPATTDGRGGGPGYQRQYSFTLGAVCDADLMLGNHWTSTAPASRFRLQCIVSIVLPRGFATMTDRTYRCREGDDTSTAEMAGPRDYRERLRTTFGISLGADEVAALDLFEG